jgi:iron(III)-enterobactin esterase
MIKQFYTFLKRAFKPTDYFVTNFSPSLQRKVTIEILLPPRYRFFQSYPLIIFNDGQDFEALNIKRTLKNLYDQQQIQEAIIVGVHCNQDRLYEYGTMHEFHYAGYGNKSHQYAAFITKELLPWLQNNFKVKKSQTHIAGFSLGGLSALDIAWHHANIFQKVGIFSGSLWWRSKPFNQKDPDADRIMINRLQKGPKRNNLQFWFQVGTHDEQDDRNNNGVIDAIDDTKDAINILLHIGYQLDDIRYTEVAGGEHNPKTWGQAMPDFLQWVLKK